MTSIRKIIALLLIVPLLSSLSGCWNYRLLEDLGIVAGVAIDKGTDDKFELTMEIADAKSGKERMVDSHIIHSSGNTIFDAVRDGISIIGKKLYWSHTQVIVVSEEIARDEMINVMDWLNRDSETRTDIELFVAKGMPAKDIFTIDNPSGNIISFTLESMIENETSLSKARKTQTWKFANDLISPGISPQTPAVMLWDNSKEQTPMVEGAALFHDSVFVGFLDGADTKNLLFVQDRIEGGLLTFPLNYQGKKLSVSLEIFENQTRFETSWTNSVPEIKITMKTIVALDELQGTPGEIDEKLIAALEEAAQVYLKNNIEATIRLVQNQYDCDTFGFGNYIYRTESQKWKKIEADWDTIFPKLKVTVVPKVMIKNSATQEKTIFGGVG